MDNRAIPHQVGGSAQLGHPVKQHVQSLLCSLCVAESLEEGVEDDSVRLQDRPEETAEEGERQVRAVRTAHVSNCP